MKLINRPLTFFALTLALMLIMLISAQPAYALDPVVNFTATDDLWKWRKSTPHYAIDSVVNFTVTDDLWKWRKSTPHYALDLVVNFTATDDLWKWRK